MAVSQDDDEVKNKNTSVIDSSIAYYADYATIPADVRVEKNFWMNPAG